MVIYSSLFVCGTKTNISSCYLGIQTPRRPESEREVEGIASRVGGAQNVHNVHNVEARWQGL
jgi:hypothetical protein